MTEQASFIIIAAFEILISFLTHLICTVIIIDCITFELNLNYAEPLNLLAKLKSYVMKRVKYE